MKLNKLAGLGIASIVLFGSVGEYFINTQPAQALEVSNNSFVTSSNLIKAKKRIKVKSRRRGRRGFKHHGRRGFRRGFRRNYNPAFINHGRRNHRNHVHFDNRFSTGNDFHESFGRVRLF
ncbi:MAG: hypothetical protein WBF90_03430 [Rivularia sp. (in: cyanobacteria)]|jgi:hypothetical protein